MDVITYPFGDSYVGNSIKTPTAVHYIWSLEHATGRTSGSRIESV